MADKKSPKHNGAVKKGVAYWQTDWMTKVMSNGHNAQAKLVFLRIASFGASGCWMNNETFGEEFSRTERTIRRAVSSLWLKGDIIIVGWDGHGRKMYATGNPEVVDKLNIQYAEARRAGKVQSLEEFNVKIRRRLIEPQPVEVSIIDTSDKEERKPKGLEYYRKQLHKLSSNSDLE